MDEEQSRAEAVRRRLAGQSPAEIARVLGRSDRWVRKWVARHDESRGDASWVRSRSRAPNRSPNRTPDQVRALIVSARRRLVQDPRGQYGALAIAWELRGLGVDPLPHAWTINRIIAEAGLARPRRRSEAYRSKNEAFHNAQHRYSTHHGAAPDEMRAGLDLTVPSTRYRPPVTLPRRGRIEVVRFVRSNRRVDLFGHRITLDEQHAYRYVTAIIGV